MKKWVYILLCFLAIAALTEECSSDNDENNPEEYIKAVNNGDYKKAHEILDNLYANYLKHPSNDAACSKFWTAAEYIYKAEMQWLIPQNDIENDKRLIYTLDALSPIGIEPIGNYPYDYKEYRDKGNDFDAYCTFASEYNKLCLELIRISMRYDNQQLAELTLRSMKTAYVRKSGTLEYEYEPTDIDKERAIKLINDLKQ